MKRKMGDRSYLAFAALCTTICLLSDAPPAAPLTWQTPLQALSASNFRLFDKLGYLPSIDYSFEHELGNVNE